MRPISLRLKGFTAFRDEQELDFSGLDLFALWGPHGSGKSSILDAITYALYGKVERVDHAGQLISQGQPRMAVALEFEAGGRRFKVTRSTPRKGGASARLDVLDGDEWRSYGEGADSIRGVNKLVVELIGLDYLAFTRSVLLPQGKFAEFLIGEPAKRRKILTELLGLELFERMSRRANEIASEAKGKAENTEQMLARHYAEVTQKTLTAARRSAEQAKKWAAETDAVRDKIAELRVSADLLDRCIVAIEESQNEVRKATEEFTGHGRTLEKHCRSLKSAEDDVASARNVVEKVKDAVEGAESDLTKALTEWGTAEQLAGLKEKTVQLEGARAEAVAAEAALAGASKALVAADEAGARYRAAVEAARAELEAKSEALEEARNALELAHQRDLVGVLVTGLETGAPCPVCERPLESIPKVSATAHERAAATAARAEKASRTADRTFGEADKALAVALQAVETARKEEQRCRAEVTKRTKSVAELENAVTAGFSGELPIDPAALVASRLTELGELGAERDSKLEELRLAEEALQNRIRAVEQAQREVERVRTAMEHAGIGRLVERASTAAPGIDVAEVLPASLPEDSEVLAQAAMSAARALERLESDLQSESVRQQEERARLAAQGRAVLPEALGVGEAELDEVFNAVSAAARSAIADAARLEAAASKLAGDLELKKSLEAEVESSRSEHNLYRALHLELRSDRIVDYLQAEALVALAGAGSERLYDLSGSRYKLAYEDDEFYVVDAWNGDERRSARTLSGGETFLASLALALALSEQVQVLAVTEKRRLESLFLDEGFDSLDPEALEIVVAAIEQLGGDERMVGIITHVAEAADRLPVRIEVEKSPRGSRLVPSVQLRA